MPVIWRKPLKKITFFPTCNKVFIIIRTHLNGRGKYPKWTHLFFVDSCNAGDKIFMFMTDTWIKTKSWRQPMPYLYKDPYLWLACPQWQSKNFINVQLHKVIVLFLRHVGSLMLLLCKGLFTFVLVQTLIVTENCTFPTGLLRYDWQTFPYLFFMDVFV